MQPHNSLFPLTLAAVLRSTARLVLPALLACAGMAATAQGRPAPLVMVFIDLPPWMIREGAAYSGAYTEIMREMARRLDRKLSIVDCPVKRCLALLEVGKADVSIGLRNSPERAGYMQFLLTPYREAVADRVFWVRRGESERIRRYEDLEELHIGIVAGGAYFPHFDSDAHLNKDTAQSNEANLRKLLLGRVDTVVIPEDQALVLIHKLRLENSIESSKYRVQDLSPRSIGIARASAMATGLLPRMEAAMQAMRRDGTLAAIYDRYYYKRFGVTRQQIRVD